VRSDDEEVAELVRGIADDAATAETTAERACLAALEGGCQVPLGALARLHKGSSLTLHACVCSVDGSTVLRASVEGGTEEAGELGRAAAGELIDRGAAALIAAIR
jgi:hydroxymethylbilane synthase